ncbi:MAG: hypothetical protein A3K19_10925 [Lentisphaerae bacterium RIFOXYB12_FULL_65_16]|nr:MAG: hypothetical protein A3K18_18130 [Lentisphaerae bacterium RIFOXYA12_64_32]OGV87855.1 MAG: hypothetical protein A3K19_10925 [Lentisphaerae bacterium RIFOXYB12_FULL_65_16]
MPELVHQNQVGNVEAITDADGNVLQRYEYDLYGAVRVLDADGNDIGDASAALMSPRLGGGQVGSARYQARS